MSEENQHRDTQFRGRTYGNNADMSKAHSFFASLRESLENPEPKKSRVSRLSGISPKSWKFLALIAIILSLTVASATVFYSLNTTLQFRVATDYGLQLEIPVGTPTVIIDFGEIPVGSSVTLSGVLRNIGNSECVVQWLITGLGVEWTFSIESPSGTAWNSGTNMTIPLGSSIPIDMIMQEVSAVGGIDYSASVAFDIVG